MSNPKNEKDVEAYLMKNIEDRIKEAVEKDGIRESFGFEDLSDIADLDGQIKENYFRALSESGKSEGLVNQVDEYLEKQRRLYGEEK